MVSRFSNILHRLRRGRGFHSHGKERSQEQNRRAPNLRDGEAFVKNGGRKQDSAEWTEELQSLGKCDSNFLNGYVIEDVCAGDTNDCGNNENEIYGPAHLEGCSHVSQRARERKKKHRGDETNETKAADGPEFGRGAFNEYAVKGPAGGCDKPDQQPSNSNVAAVRARLEPKDTYGTE